MSIIDRGVDLLREIGLWRRAGLPIMDTEGREARYSLCKPCDEFDTGRCRKCGCFMAVKTWLATARCPLIPPKWDATVTMGDVTSPWLFGDQSKLLELRVELAEWIGTPFWSGTAGRAVAGVKADCVSFVERVMVNIGAMQPIVWPEYVTHTGGERMGEVLIATLRSVKELRMIWAPAVCPLESLEVMEGDILAGSSGRAHHHLAIAGEEDTVWHCTEQDGVCRGTRSDPMLSKHLVAVFRFKT